MERTKKSADKKPATRIGLNNPNFKKDLTDLTFAEPTKEDLLAIEREIRIREKDKSSKEIDIISLYYSEEDLKNPLLDFEEERELGIRIQNGLTLKNPNRPKVADNSILSKDAHDAVDTLVTHNLRLVISVAKKSRVEGYCLEI